MRLLFLSAIVAVFAGAAQAESYDCKLVVPTAENWVPAELRVTHDPATGAVTVFDTIIQAYVGKPIEGTVNTDNAKRITFGWKLKMIINGSNQTAPQFIYSATYFKATGKVQVKAIPAGYPNHFIAQGKCKLK